MSDQMPGTPGQPPEKKGLSTGAIVAIVIVAIVLLLFGICVAGAMLSSGG
jgi:flagellar basal body-associated protein FliL